MKAKFKTSFITKSVLLFLPLISILWWFLFQDVSSSGGMGGGGYTLNSIYCFLWLAAFLIFYEFILLINLWALKRKNLDTKETNLFLLIAFLILILVIILSMIMIN
jgi:hypothetical protein